MRTFFLFSAFWNNPAGFQDWYSGLKSRALYLIYRLIFVLKDHEEFPRILLLFSAS